jgi:dolichol-phosphate mannosyltransferase
VRLLSIVVPVRNEAENVPPLFAALRDAVHVPCELLLVYDAEHDPTIGAAREAAAALPFPLRLVKNDLGRGPANALRTGFAAAHGDAVAVVMADLSDDVALIDRMVARLDAGDDVVCASRYAPGGQQIGGPRLKRTLSRLAGVSLHLAGLPAHDATNSFRVYRTALLRSITIESREGFEITLEITVKAWRGGWRVSEMPARWCDRVAGKSKFRLWRWLPQYLHWYCYGLSGAWTRRRTPPTTADRGQKESS